MGMKARAVCKNCLIVLVGVIAFLIYLKLTSPHLIIDLNDGIVTLILKLFDSVISKDAFIAMIIAALPIVAIKNQKHKNNKGDKDD